MNASPMLVDPLGAFCPWAQGENKRLRQQLLRARDLAGSNLAAAASDHARALLWMVVETATAWAFASANVDELGDARRQCIRLLLCASFAEREPVR